MAKLLTMFLVLIALNACLLVYTGNTEASPDTNNSLWSFIMDPTSWSGLTFILAIAGIAGSIILATGISLTGVGLGVKTDTIIFAVFIPGLIAIGSTFVNLYNIVYSELTSRFFGGSTVCNYGSTFYTCTPSAIIAGIFISPIAFYYIWTVVSWWRGQDY